MGLDTFEGKIIQSCKVEQNEYPRLKYEKIQNRKYSKEHKGHMSYGERVNIISISNPGRRRIEEE